MVPGSFRSPLNDLDIPVIYMIKTSYPKELEVFQLDLWLIIIHCISKSIVINSPLSMSFMSKSELEISSATCIYNCIRVAPVSLEVCDRQVLGSDLEGRLTWSKL